MITDMEIRIKGLQILTEHLGDYTKWRQGLDEDLSIEEISKIASTVLYS